MRENDGQLNHEEFLAEAGEILESIGTELQRAEADLSAGTVRATRINALFRGVHSLKGIAGLLGRRTLIDTAHLVEDYLDCLRMGRASFDPTTLNILYDAHEILEKMVGGVRVPATVRRRLVARLEAHDEAGGERPDTTDGGLDPRIVSSLTQYEEHRLRQCLTAGTSVSLVHVGLEFETFDTELRSLITGLNEIGEVISTLPSYAADANQQGMAFLLIFAGSADEQAVRHHTGMTVNLTPVCPDLDAGEGLSADEPTPIEDQGETDLSMGEFTSSVRVDLERLDRIMNSVGELIVTRRGIDRLARQLTDKIETRTLGQDLARSAQDLGKKLDDLQRSVIGARMVPVGQIVGRLSRLVRKLARQAGKDIRFRSSGERTELDKVMIDRLLSPLMHLIRNAVDHGVESPEERQKAGKAPHGVLQLTAAQRGNSVVLGLVDDGRGLDLDAIAREAASRGLTGARGALSVAEAGDLIFQAGFSTAEEVSEVSGRGVGLDVVRREIAALNGSIRLDTRPGHGTTFEIELPITLAIIQSIVTRAGDHLFAIPVSAVAETVRVSDDRMATVARRQVVRLRGETLPMVRLGAHFRLHPEENGHPEYVVVLRSGDRTLALGVDELLGQQEVVIKAIGRRLENIPGLAGATELGENQAALVVDPTSLAAELFGAPSTVLGG